MADFAIQGNGGSCTQAGFDYSNTTGTTVTASASANTLGSYTEILSAANNTFHSEWVAVTLQTIAGVADATYLVSVALGAGNTVIMPTLFAWSSVSANRNNIFRYAFPVHIPAGQRLSAACQSSVGSSVIDVHFQRLKASMLMSRGLGGITAIGANTADSGGVSVARSTANTFGSWTEITSSLAKNARGFVVAAIRPVTSWGDGELTFDVGVGGAGAEQVIYSGHLINTTSAEDIKSAVTPFIPVGIAAGQRVAIRAQANVTGTDFDFDYILYVVR